MPGYCGVNANPKQHSHKPKAATKPGKQTCGSQQRPQLEEKLWWLTQQNYCYSQLPLIVHLNASEMTL
jgi:hypothetical protein